MIDQVLTDRLSCALAWGGAEGRVNYWRGRSGCDPDTEAAIQVAKAGIELMRADLLRALGLTERTSRDFPG